MERREPPATEEGWYALHDFRRIDWSAWRSAPTRERDRALREGADFLRSAADPAEGESTVFSVTGHKADLLFLHFRPDLADCNALERAFEQTALAEFTERTTSYVSVAETSGYNVDLDAVLEGEADSGLERYIQSRLEPTVPGDADYVCFYPMDKRRDPEQNWYDLPFEERAEHMEAHGDIGRDYAGKVSQVVTSAIGFDDWEWGVTLFAQDAAQIKRLLYEMRFDPSTSQFAEFGPFYVGQQIDPEDLRPLFAGERVPGGGGDALTATAETDVEAATRGEAGGPPPGVADGEAGGPPDWVDTGGEGESKSESEGDGGGGAHLAGGDGDAEAELRSELAEAGVYGGQPHGEDVYAVVVYSEADPEELFEEVEGLRANFEHYGTHVKTAVYDRRRDEGDDRLSAVASVWETESAADTAGGFLSDLPAVVGQAGDDPESDTWGTMGMFYTVEPDYREDFHEKFDEVLSVLGDSEGHVETDLMVNREQPEDMFIASRWESRADATGFFRSDAFTDTVDWGRDVLADRPRHVFLA
jgi:chlorite dismutase